MKIAKIIFQITIIVLIILFFTFLRIALPAMPYDWRPFLYLRFILSGGFSGPDYWHVWDIFTAVIGICCIFAVPVEGSCKGLRRFLLRPIALVLVFVLSSPYVNTTVESAHTAYKEYQDRQYQAKVDARTMEIQAFIEIADEAYAYDNSQYQGENYLTAFPELVLEDKYVTDTLLIDYDTMTIGFCFHHITMFELKTFSMEISDQLPESYEWKETLDLVDSGGQLTVYFNYRDGSAGNGCTAICIAITMPDGTTYIAQDLTNPETGYNYFIGHIAGNYYVHIADFPERE